MVGSESTGRSEGASALNARALGCSRARWPTASPYSTAARSRSRKIRDVPFSVVGLAVAQATPVAVIERFNEVGCIPPTPLCWQTRKGW